jgi:hypothetical protein
VTKPERGSMGTIEYEPERVIIDIKGPRTIAYHSSEFRASTSKSEQRVDSSLQYIKIKKLKNKNKIV